MARDVSSGTYDGGSDRFTRKGDAVFAFMMRIGGAVRATIHSPDRLHEKEIVSVEVTGRLTEIEPKDGALPVRLLAFSKAVLPES